MTFRLFVLATFLACALSLVCPVVAGAQAGSATATTSILHPNGPEAFSHVAPLTREEHEILDEKLEKLHDAMVQKKGTVPLGPQVPVPTNNRETKPAAAFTDLKGPIRLQEIFTLASRNRTPSLGMASPPRPNLRLHKAEKIGS